MDNIKHVWTVLCDKAIVDSNSNHISLLNSIEEITLDADNKERARLELEQIKKNGKKILAPISFTVVSLWYHEIKNDKTVIEVVEFVNQMGKVSWQKEHELKFSNQKKRTRAIMQFNGVELYPEVGTYHLNIKIKDGNMITKVAEIPVDFKMNI